MSGKVVVGYDDRGEARDALALGSASCPPEDVEHVLDALIENALLYGTPSNGAPREIVVRAGPGRRLEVLDHGPGLDRDESERVFERFHRGRVGRRQAEGTGLGLAIARGLARAWGGDVSLENRPSGGGCASVTFSGGPNERVEHRGEGSDDA